MSCEQHSADSGATCRRVNTACLSRFLLTQSTMVSEVVFVQINIADNLLTPRGQFKYWKFIIIRTVGYGVVAISLLMYPIADTKSYKSLIAPQKYYTSLLFVRTSYECLLFVRNYYKLLPFPTKRFK